MVLMSAPAVFVSAIPGGSQSAGQGLRQEMCQDFVPAVDARLPELRSPDPVDQMERPMGNVGKVLPHARILLIGVHPAQRVELAVERARRVRRAKSRSDLGR